VVGELDAGELFDAITRAAWRTGDPGLVFLDTIDRAQPTPQIGAIEATNPCGEIPLLPYESCNLGSINLSHMLEGEAGERTVAWDRLRATTHTAVRFLDDVIEVGRYPVPEIERMTHANRKIGLGVMGFADMLIRLGISYDSDRAVEKGGEIMRFIAAEARAASAALAEERGAFPNWKGSRLEGEGVRVRNATQTAIAPTGTISLIAGASASIEPLFALAYRRSHVLEEQTLIEVNPVFLETIREAGLNPATVVPTVLEQGSLHAVPGIPDDLKHLLATALEIPAERHLAIQAAFQRHVDNSVSKTINLPAEATVEDVARIYRRAWELGLKGITIYRYGSKGAQVLELGVAERSYHYDHATPCDPTECRV
jgi:ribonucleoside-diphosphate reductase alpha chain